MVGMAWFKNSMSEEDFLRTARTKGYEDYVSLLETKTFRGLSGKAAFDTALYKIDPSKTAKGNEKKIVDKLTRLIRTEKDKATPAPIVSSSAPISSPLKAVSVSSKVSVASSALKKSSKKVATPVEEASAGAGKAPPDTPTILPSPHSSTLTDEERRIRALELAAEASRKTKIEQSSKGATSLQTLKAVFKSAAEAASSAALPANPEESTQYAKLGIEKVAVPLLEADHAYIRDEKIKKSIKDAIPIITAAEGRFAWKRGISQLPALQNPVVGTSFLEKLNTYIPTTTGTTTNKPKEISNARKLAWEEEKEKRNEKFAENTRKQQEGLLRPPDWNEANPLFSPKTGKPFEEKKPIENVLKLGKECDDFAKSQQVKLEYPLGSEAPYNINNDTNIYGFIVKVFLNPQIDTDEMVSFRLQLKSYVGNDAYEMLSLLFVFFGGIPGIQPRYSEPGFNYIFCDKFEIKDATEYNLFENATNLFIKSGCKATNENGISDVSLFHNDVRTRAQRQNLENVRLPSNNKKVFKMSVKFFENETSPEKDYDISDLYTHKIPFIDPEKDVGIVVFVKSRNEFTEKCKDAIAGRYEPIKLCQQIYGWEQDVSPFLDTIRKRIFQIAERYEITPIEVFNGIFNIPSDTPQTRPE